MDIYERLKQDHDKLRALYKQLKELQGGDAQDVRPVFDEYQRELWSHGKIEEIVFYAPLRHAPETRGEVFEGLNEHHVIETILSELLAMSIDEAWTGKLQVLGELVEHHLKEEEDEIFKMARSVLSEEDATRLAGEMDRRKASMLAALAPLGS